MVTTSGVSPDFSRAVLAPRLAYLYVPVFRGRSANVMSIRLANLDHQHEGFLARKDEQPTKDRIQQEARDVSVTLKKF